MVKWNFRGQKEPPGPGQLVVVERRGPGIFARIDTKEVGTRETPEISVPLVAAIDDAGAELKFLVINTSKVEFLNSTGLGMLVDLHDRVQALGGQVILFGMSGPVLQILKTVSVDRMFTIVNSREELAKVLK